MKAEKRGPMKAEREGPHEGKEGQDPNHTRVQDQGWVLRMLHLRCPQATGSLVLGPGCHLACPVTEVGLETARAGEQRGAACTTLCAVRGVLACCCRCGLVLHQLDCNQVTGRASAH